MSAVIVIGNPVDGLEFIGPFASVDVAMTYSENYLTGKYTWWVSKLDSP